MAPRCRMKEGRYPGRDTLTPRKNFATKSPDQHGSLPFLDTLVSQAPSGSLITTVYRKPHIQINT